MAFVFLIIRAQYSLGIEAQYGIAPRKGKMNNVGSESP